MSIEYAFGARDPKSVLGTWNKAFVILKSNGIITLGFFDDSTDYIGHLRTDTEAINYYNSLIYDGYIPMTPTDIEMTSGITISNSTITNPTDIYISYTNSFMMNMHKLINIIKSYFYK
jgi:hypothetical protein